MPTVRRAKGTLKLIGKGRVVHVRNTNTMPIKVGNRTLYPGESADVADVDAAAAGLPIEEYSPAPPTVVSAPVLSSSQLHEYPLVSIVIPTRNRLQMLNECLASVARQPYEPKEVIVVDDASEHEGACTCAASYGATYVRLAEQQGVSRARNVGNMVASGEIIAEIDDDDRLADNALGLAVKALEEADYVYGHCQKVGGGNQLVRRPAYYPGVFCEGSLSFGFRAYRKVVWRAIGGFDEGLEAAIDLDFALRAEEAGARFVLVDAVLAYYRRHEEQISRRNADKQNELARKVITVAKRRRSTGRLSWD